jgi:hypothetical protein
MLHGAALKPDLRDGATCHVGTVTTDEGFLAAGPTGRLNLARLRTWCSDLDAEPMWTLSMGSKELFHSNLLGWICERLSPKDAAYVLGLPPMQSGAASGTVVIRREYKNFDLTVELPGYPAAVIENKVFSLPDMDQLEEYTPKVIKALGGEPDLILVSLMEPGWPGDEYTVNEHTWRLLRWTDVSARLDKLLEAERASGLDEFSEALIRHEASLLRLLDKVMQEAAIKSRDETVALAAPVRAAMDSRLGAAVRKYRAHQVLPMIKEAYEDAGLTPSITEINYTNGEPLLAAYWFDDDEDFAVGWQMQHRQWRLAMIMNHRLLSGKAAGDKRSAFAAQQTDWFNFQPMHAVLGVNEADVLVLKRRPDKHGFNRYNPNFVYTYQRLPDATTVDALVDLAVAYGRRAQDWTLPTYDPGDETSGAGGPGKTAALRTSAQDTRHP